MIYMHMPADDDYDSGEEEEEEGGRGGTLQSPYQLVEPYTNIMMTEQDEDGGAWEALRSHNAESAAGVVWLNKVQGVDAVI